MPGRATGGPPKSENLSNKLNTNTTNNIPQPVRVHWSDLSCSELWDKKRFYLCTELLFRGVVVFFFVLNGVLCTSKFTIIKVDNAMIELGNIRHRVKGYQQVATYDDEFDDSYDGSSIPPLKVYSYENVTSVVKPPSKSCKYADSTLFPNVICHLGAWIGLCLSISGVIFLSTIAYSLGNSSPYIKVSKELEEKKHELAGGVMGAIVLYIITGMISIYHILNIKVPLPWMRDDRIPLDTRFR